LPQSERQQRPGNGRKPDTALHGARGASRVRTVFLHVSQGARGVRYRWRRRLLGASVCCYARTRFRRTHRRTGLLAKQVEQRGLAHVREAHDPHLEVVLHAPGSRQAASELEKQAARCLEPHPKRAQLVSSSTAFLGGMAAALVRRRGRLGDSGTIASFRGCLANFMRWQQKKTGVSHHVVLACAASCG